MVKSAQFLQHGPKIDINNYIFFKNFPPFELNGPHFKLKNGKFHVARGKFLVARGNVEVETVLFYAQHMRGNSVG